MDKYKFDIDAFVRTIILSGFTILLVWLIATQQLSLYINPKFTILSELAAVVLVLMCIVLAPKIVRKVPGGKQEHAHAHTHTGGWTYLPFGIVLLLAVLIPNNTLNANLVDTKGLNMNLAAIGAANAKPANTKEPVAKPLDNKVQNPSPPPAAEPVADVAAGKKEIPKITDSKAQNLAPPDNTGPVADKQPKPSGNTTGTSGQASNPASFSQVPWESLASEAPPKQTGMLSITQNNFVEAIHDIYERQSDYVGKEVSIIGFVYRNPNLPDNQFVLVRYLIACCASDASPYGLLCELKDAKKYPQGTWLSVRGMLKISNFNDTDTPTIKITSVEKVEKPQNPYVFLN